MGLRVKVDIHQDPFMENPNDEDCQWKLYSFNSRHLNSIDARELVSVSANGDRWYATSPGLRTKLRVGLAFGLAYYEHGLCRWTLQGGAAYDPWDSCPFAGLLIWEHKPDSIGAKTYADRQEDAREWLKRYTHWANGGVYAFEINDAYTDEVLEEEYEMFGEDDLREQLKCTLAVNDYEVVSIGGEYGYVLDASDFVPKKRQAA